MPKDDSLVNELDFHLEQLTREKIAAGMNPDDARRQARLELGGPLQIREQVLDERGSACLDNLAGDFWFALRNLKNSRSYAMLAIITLGLGIGCNTALFSVIHAVAIKPLPFASDERLVQLNLFDLQARRASTGFSVKELDDLREQSQTIDGLVEFHAMRFILLGRAESQAVDTGVVSAAYFDYLGVKPLHGRNFTARDERHGAPAVLLLGHRYFKNSFGGDPNVVGTTVRMNDRVHTIVGVMPPLPEYPSKVDVYMPTTSCPTRDSPQFRASRRSRMMTAFARLKPGVGATQSEQEMKALTRRMRELEGDSYPKHDDWGIRVASLREELARQAKPAFMMLFAATAFVLLIACANIANLTMARMMQRRRELAIRSSIGATQARLLEQLLVEALVVGTAACSVALLLAWQTIALLTPLVARFSTRAQEIQLDRTVMLFCAGITMLTSGMAYLLPAWPALRNLVAAAREGSHGSTASGGQIRARGLLVSVQVGLSFLLLAGAGLLLRSFYELVNTDSGVQMERVLSMRVNPNWTKINTPQKYIELFQSLLDRIRATPGVMAAGIGNKVPLNQRLPVTRNFLIEGQAPPDGAPKPVLDLAAVSVGYFETLRVPVMRGRLFAESDGPDSPRVALVNDIMAKHYWPQKDPIGRRVSLDNGQQWTTIVGVIPNIKQYSLDTEVGDELYLPFLQNSSGTNVVVRSALDPGALAGHLRQAVHGIDPDHAVSAIQTLEEIRQESVAPQRLLTLLLTLFSALTLAITIAGIGGVAALSVEQRRSEIGIRVACGARPGEIVGLVLRQHLSLVVAGMVAGVAASLALGRVMSTFLYRTQPTDAVTFASVCLLVMAVGAIACWVPARRASVMDPMKSLRAE